MRSATVALSVTLAMAAQAGEPAPQVPITWFGHLESAAGNVDGSVDAAFRVLDSGGAVLFSLDAPGTLVVDGDMAIDLVVPATAEGLLVEVTIDGVVLTPAVPLVAEWPRAASAGSVTRASAANDALLVGDRDSVMRRSSFEAGSVAVPFEQVSGFPAAFADGDQGLDFVAGATLDFSAGTIGIRTGSLPGTALASGAQAVDFVAGSVTGVDFRDATVTGSDFNLPLPLTKLATRTLTARHLSGGTRPVFAVVEPRCLSDKVDRVTASPTCVFTGTTSCTPPGGGSGHRPCAGLNQPTSCFSGTTSSCPNIDVGVLVFE